MPDSTATNAASYTTRWDTIAIRMASCCRQDGAGRASGTGPIYGWNGNVFDAGSAMPFDWRAAPISCQAQGIRRCNRDM